jgi:hypothetical protein
MLPLLAIGGLNAFILQPRVVDATLQLRGASTDTNEPTPEAAETLQRLLSTTVRIEAVLGVLVLIAVAVLIQLSPPRATAEAEAAIAAPSGVLPQDEAGYWLKANNAGGLVLALRIEPAEIGTNNFELGLGSEFGGIGEVTLAKLDFAHTSDASAASDLELGLLGSAKYSADADNIGQAGEWEVTATVSRRGEEDITSTFTVPIGAAGGDESTSDNRFAWPFEGAQSVGAIIAIAVGCVGLVVVGAWQFRALRRGRA